jgi:mRNA interferase MazF
MMKGKVVLVPFPFDDLSTIKIGPAVCLTDPVGPHRHLIMAFISSRMSIDQLDTDMILNSGHIDFAMTGLLVTSTVRLHRLMTVTTALIRRELGELTPQMQDEVANKLRKLFGLA